MLSDEAMRIKLEDKKKKGKKEIDGTLKLIQKRLVHKLRKVLQSNNMFFAFLAACSRSFCGFCVIFSSSFIQSFARLPLFCLPLLFPM